MNVEGRELARRLYRGSVLVNNYYKDQISSAMEQVAGELGLTGKTKFSQHFILCELHFSQGMTLTQISEATNVTLPNVSNTVSELVNLGLVARKEDGADRRKTMIHITELGAEFGNRIIPHCIEINDILLGEEKEASRVLAFYDRILKRIEEQK